MKWSYSAHQTLHRCQRQFVFDYVIASHNAKDEFRRRTFLLKQLKQIPTWEGSLVHHTLAKELPLMLQNNHPYSPQSFMKSAKCQALLQFAFSKDGKYRSISKSLAGEEYCALFEHEYKVDISPDWISGVETHLGTCFSNLEKHTGLINYIRSGSAHQFEKMVIAKFDGINLNAQLDLYLIGSKGIPGILDWKVARSETSYYQ